MASWAKAGTAERASDKAKDNANTQKQDAAGNCLAVLARPGLMLKTLKKPREIVKAAAAKIELSF
jgi:hypothetical protein